MLKDIRIGQAYVGDDGQWYYYTQGDCDAYNQGAKDAYYSRYRHIEYFRSLTDTQKKLYREAYNDEPFGRKEA